MKEEKKLDPVEVLERSKASEPIKYQFIQYCGVYRIHYNTGQQFFPARITLFDVKKKPVVEQTLEDKRIMNKLKEVATNKHSQEDNYSHATPIKYYMTRDKALEEKTKLNQRNKVTCPDEE